MADIGFDWESAEDVSFEPIPPGKYRALCLEITDKENEKGLTRQVKLEIQDGQYKGRKVVDFLLINHPSEQAMKISRGRFKQFVLATGIRPNDTDDLIGHEVFATVKVRKDQNDNLQNQVSSYAPLKGDSKQAPGPKEQAAPAAPAKPAAPWKK